MGIFEEFLSGAFQDDATVLQHICPMTNRKGMFDILLNQKDGHPFLINSPDGFQDLLDENWGQTEGGFIQEKNLGKSH